MQPAPLSRSFLNSSFNLTKRAFLSEKASPSPSLNVDQHPSQRRGVRLVTRLLRPWSPHTYSSGTGDLLPPQAPVPGRVWSPVPTMTSKGLLGPAAWLGPSLSESHGVLVITATGHGRRSLSVDLGLQPSRLCCFVSLLLHPHPHPIRSVGTLGSGQCCSLGGTSEGQALDPALTAFPPTLHPARLHWPLSEGSRLSRTERDWGGRESR